VQNSCIEVQKALQLLGRCITNDERSPDLTILIR